MGCPRRLQHHQGHHEDPSAAATGRCRNVVPTVDGSSWVPVSPGRRVGGPAGPDPYHPIWRRGGEPQRPRIITSSEFNSAPSKPNQATLQHAEERRRDNNLSIFLLLLQRTYQLFTTTTATHTKKTQPSLLLKAARPEEVLLTITREGVDHRTRSHRVVN